MSNQPNTEPSNTPRTASETVDIIPTADPRYEGPCQWVPAYFARQLETELATVTKERDNAVSESAHYNEQLKVTTTQRDAHAAEVTKLRAELETINSRCAELVSKAATKEMVYEAVCQQRDEARSERDTALDDVARLREVVEEIYYGDYDKVSELRGKMRNALSAITSDRLEEDKAKRDAARKESKE